MSTSILKLDEINFDDLNDTLIVDQPSIRNEILRSAAGAVAIIGMEGRVGAAENLEAFWELLTNGQEGLRPLPEERRRDLDQYLAARGVSLPLPESLYFNESFLTDIAGFDHSFFGISQQEARYMDPNQRVFLETAWRALENSGYGGEEIQGTDTGIFVGFSSDFGQEYRHMLSHLAPDASEVAVAGNIKSIIASRLAYHLNLKGPSLLVDTACSSGLVAIYLACQSIRRGECSMAIAGAVKCDFVPLAEDSNNRVGTKDIKDTAAHDGRTRTFDDACDGTAAAEGAFAFVLKPLEEAQRDGDAIRAVILGGAINQDGASNGITAPNSESQEDLIVRALGDAGVAADSISYIEAHGTATRLGDPIEISGIQRAFQHFTNRKQFCAIGSLKTNIGHLDNASGAGGLAKVVLSMQHRMIPASLNFSVPNRNIPFVQSPVYVNSYRAPWSQNPEEVLRAGINSFGLSGTNCHLILESAPPRPQRLRSEELGHLLLPLSAKSFEALQSLAAAYGKYLADETIDLADAVMTASKGRLHHSFRLAVIFDSRDQLCRALDDFSKEGTEALSTPCLNYGKHRLVMKEENRRRDTDICEAQGEQMARKALEMVEKEHRRPTFVELSEWAKFYTAGAVLPWDYLTLNLKARRIPLPAYPFQHVRCWPEVLYSKVDDQGPGSHPLLGEVAISTIDHTLFKSSLGPERNWELSEHRIHGKSLLPGTALVEMMVDGALRLNQKKLPLCFKDIIFEQPFMVADGTVKELHLLVEEEGDTSYLRFASISTEGVWVQHALGRLKKESDGDLGSSGRLDLKGLEKGLSKTVAMDSSEDLLRGLELSERWNNSFISCRMDDANQTILIELALPSEYGDEENRYHLHPALMDAAINAANNMMGDGELYLPLSYGELIIHRPLPGHFFAHLHKTSSIKGEAIHRFNICLYDIAGELVLEIRNYCIKSASKAFEDMKREGAYGYRQVFRPYDIPAQGSLPSGTILLAGKGSETCKDLLAILKDKGHSVIEITPQGGDWKEALKPLLGETLALAIFVWDPPRALKNQPELWEEEANEAVYQGFEFLKAWTAAKLKAVGGLVALTYSGWAVEEADQVLHPGQRALSGLWRVAALELETLHLRAIDLDEIIPSHEFIKELEDFTRPAFLAYRSGQAFQPEIEAAIIPTEERAVFNTHDSLFLLSGGTGELGIEVAGLLSRCGIRKLVLLGSKPVPPRDLWEELADQATDAELRKRLKGFIRLEQGLEVLEVRSVQMEDYQAVNHLVSQLRKAYGPIGGVLHLAGRPGDGFLFQKTGEVFQRVYGPKANGAWSLHLATQEDNPAVFIEFSSISSLSLNAGQTDYTAANMFLDSLAEFRRQQGLAAVSLQWPAWRETGIARRMGAVDENELYLPVNTEEALGLLNKVLWKGNEVPPVLMPGRIRPKADSGKRSPNSSIKKEVILMGMEAPDKVDMEVAGIWARTLEVYKLEADDEFSSLGGNSLLTAQMLREYEKRYPGIMEIADLFTYTTILSQSEYIKLQLGLTSSTEKSSEAKSDNDLDQILELVSKGEMTVEESSSRISFSKRRDK